MFWLFGAKLGLEHDWDDDVIKPICMKPVWKHNKNIYFQDSFTWVVLL